MEREIFISYSRRNIDRVKEIKAEIESATGANCWIDLTGIESGAPEFNEVIVNGIMKSKVFLFMLSNESQESKYAIRELEFARYEIDKGTDKKMVIVNIDGCEMEPVFRFLYGCMNIIDWNDTEQHDKLIRDLKNWVGVKEEEESDKIITQQQPKITNTPKFEGKKIFNVKGVEFAMVAVEGGTFQMGSNDGDDYEEPVHSVTLSSYYIGQTEVTQALWTAVMGRNPSRFKGDNLPVECVSWNDCQTFINKLNQLTGERFRLPTEAEWEFAARGGNKSKGYIYSGSDEIDDVAWHEDNSYGETQPVGTKAPNELGIYDMSGNVWEWCQDWMGDYPSSAQTNPAGPASGSFRVFRGGSWYSNATGCRTAFRNDGAPSFTGYHLGFRLALSK